MLHSKTKKIQFNSSQFLSWVKFTIYNLMYMIIHVKRQLRHSCIKSVESEETRITQHMKKHLFVSFLFGDFISSDIFFLQIQRFKIMVTYSSHHSLDFSCLNPWSLPCKSNVKELFSNYPQL